VPQSSVITFTPASPWTGAVVTCLTRSSARFQLWEPSKAYVRELRRDRQSQIDVHANWTALRFAGKSDKEIARIELEGSPYQDPQQAVRRAVERFADGFG
jgi:hypothetical protein